MQDLIQAYTSASFRSYPKSKNKPHMRGDMRFPTMWHVQSAKAQTRLPIPAVRSEPLLVP